METTTMRIHGCLLNLKDYKEAEKIAYPPGECQNSSEEDNYLWVGKTW